jgi:hypothetical protein
LNARDTPQLGKQLLLPGDGFKVSIVSDDDPDDADTDAGSKPGCSLRHYLCSE